MTPARLLAVVAASLMLWAVIGLAAYGAHCAVTDATSATQGE